MNFLAHLYLSDNRPNVMLGNFIGDFVKGKGYENYKCEVQQGILLHRKIDAFTDKQRSFKNTCNIFKPAYGRYSSVIVDVVYDHFLANLWDNYSDISLDKFVNRCHRILVSHYFTLPNKVKGFLPFLIQSRRLENYKNIKDLERSLEIMSNNSSLPPGHRHAMEILQQNREEIQIDFELLFEDLQAMVFDELKNVK